MVGRLPLARLEVEVTQVRYLRPIRVLVASRDSRFLNLTRFLLARNGFLVQATRKLSRIPECVERQWAEVLVLDASGSPAGAARTAEIVQGAEPDLAVVLVAEETGAGPIRGRRFLEKWSLQTLTAEIESAYMRAGGHAQAVALHQDEAPLHIR
jgi:hypothetical protein